MDKTFEEKCFKIPYFLFSDKYKKLSLTAKILYGILYTKFLNVLEKSEKEDAKDSSAFRDRVGLFVEFNIETVAGLIDKSSSFVYSLLNLLEVAGLIGRVSADGRIRVYFKL